MDHRTEGRSREAGFQSPERWPAGFFRGERGQNEGGWSGGIFTNAFEARYISLARIGNLLLDVAGVEDYDRLLLNGRAENIVLQDEEIAVIGAVRLEVL